MQHEKEREQKWYPKLPIEPCQARRPTKQALGPSAPTKSLLYLQNIYKIPANNPFITLCLCCPVYLPLLSISISGEDNSGCVFISVNESHVHTQNHSECIL